MLCSKPSVFRNDGEKGWNDGEVKGSGGRKRCDALRWPLGLLLLYIVLSACFLPSCLRREVEREIVVPTLKLSGSEHHCHTARFSVCAHCGVKTDDKKRSAEACRSVSSAASALATAWARRHSDPRSAGRPLGQLQPHLLAA